MHSRARNASSDTSLFETTTANAINTMCHLVINNCNRCTTAISVKISTCDNLKNGYMCVSDTMDVSKIEIDTRVMNDRLCMPVSAIMNVVKVTNMCKTCAAVS